jgi:ABC-type multidrug transport system ATPase subunit
VSSDAMDEVEAICTRVCALVDGDVAAVDTPRRMKARHGLSYHLRVTLRGGGGGDDAAAAPSDQSDTATSASPDDVAACHAVVRSVAPSALTSETASFDGGVGCAYELSRLSLPGLARLCAKARSVHWSPYERVGVVNADP